MTSPAPKLAPPGAGLPPLELFIVRFIFWFSALTTPTHLVIRRLTDIFSKRHQPIKDLPEALLSRQVLIARLPGLEDSSRYWSVYMTLAHMRIVNEAVASVIQTLNLSKVPQGAVSTASVKPSPDSTAREIKALELSIENLAAVLKTAKAGTPLFPHPWFGALTARQWGFMALFHMQLHRLQIERILAGQTKP
jgi:hypothetical protein